MPLIRKWRVLAAAKHVEQRILKSRQDIYEREITREMSRKLFPCRTREAAIYRLNKQYRHNRHWEDHAPQLLALAQAYLKACSMVGESQEFLHLSVLEAAQVYDWENELRAHEAETLKRQGWKP